MQENIDAYVKACKAIGVPDPELFMTVDLYEARNMNAVCNHLAAFSVILLSPFETAISSRELDRCLTIVLLGAAKPCVSFSHRNQQARLQGCCCFRRPTYLVVPFV